MIHKYFSNGFYIVLDVNSGAVHVVSETVYKLLDCENIESATDVCELSLENCTAETIEAFNEIKEMQKQGLLFTEDTYEKLATQIKRNPVVKALCLHVAHDCNLRCGYCFANTGDYHDKRGLMSFEVGKKAIDFVIENSASRKNIEIDFFGGEPLMNFDVVKQIVEYARSRENETNKKFRFTITTNGLLLTDDKIEYINSNMDNVVLSLDGRKSVNDNIRKRLDDSGSYDSIVPKFKSLVDKRGDKEYYVRGTFTKYNLDFADDVIHINELGFKNVSVEPVVVDESAPYAILEADLPEIFDEYDKLAKIYIKRREENNPFTFFHFMVDLDQGPCVIKRMSGCGAGCEYLAVTPEGDLYPCHQFVGNEQFKMGTVFEGRVNEEIKNKFENTSVYHKEECRKCWAKFYCSGGCSANAYNENGDLKIPYETGCKMQRKRIENAIMIKAALAK